MLTANPRYILTSYRQYLNEKLHVIVKQLEIFTHRVLNGYNILAEMALNEVYFHATPKSREVYKAVGTINHITSQYILNF